MRVEDLIINKMERSSNDWRPGAGGNRSLEITEEMLKTLGGRAKMVEQVKNLQDAGLLNKVKWIQGRFDVENITWSVENLSQFYALSGRKSKYEILAECKKHIEVEKEVISKDWILAYYDSLLIKIEKVEGKKIPDDIKLDENLVKCLRGLNQLEGTDGIYKRVFSKKILNNSKLFETAYQKKLLLIARKFNDEIDEEMDDSQALEQLMINDYSQELAVKGNLNIEIAKSDNLHIINLGDFIYGAILNTEMLKHSKICRKQNIQRIITVENKANYMQMPYEEGTLIIFCHGYFTPRERMFLKSLNEILPEAEFYHSGDMDYGGIRIFQFIRKYLFPKLKPYQMDVKTYEQNIDYAVSVEKGYLEKMRGMKEKLEKEKTNKEILALLRKLIEEQKIIEQESFLL